MPLARDSQFRGVSQSTSLERGKNRIDIITHLMHNVLSAAHPEYSFSVLGIRRRRLHTIVPPAGLDAILTAEIAYIESLWPNV